jgi:thiamine-monophosphate kinase
MNGDTGEFALIERLRALLPAPTGDDLIVGIGDDAAVWRAGERYVIATTDTMVESVHFLPERASWREVGWKALAVNISDIAAMGGAPKYALVTLCLPPNTSADLDEVYRGLAQCAGVYGVTVAGGDIVRAPAVAITVALCGDARVSSEGEILLLRRDAARPAHMHPYPRVDAGAIAVAAGIGCGMDMSDGLVQDLGHICRASGVDAAIEAERVPVDETAASLFPGDARMLALTGGEDYELLLVGREALLELADQALRKHLKTARRQIHVIGRITGEGAGGVRVVDARGEDVALPRGGWDHLRATQ